MTESKTEKSAKRGGLAWEKARRVPFLSQYAKGLTDWPDAFSPKDLAALQYPAEGTDPMRNRKALTAILTRLVEDGDIPAVTVNYIPPAPRMPTGPMVVLHDDPWMRLDVTPSSYQPLPEPPPPPKLVEFKAIGREPFAAWFHGQGEEPSEHIRAWLPELPVKRDEPQKATLAGVSAPKATCADIAEYHAERVRAQSKRPAPDTAEHFGVSDRWVRECVKTEKAKPKSAVGHQIRQGQKAAAKKRGGK